MKKVGANASKVTNHTCAIGMSNYCINNLISIYILSQIVIARPEFEKTSL